MRILIAIDGSPCSNAAVAEVIARPWPATSEFKVLTAYELPLMPSPEAWATSAAYYERLEEAVRENAQSTATAACLKLRDALGESFTITSQIVDGFTEGCNPRTGRIMERGLDRDGLSRLQHLGALSSRISFASCRIAREMLGRSGSLQER
jgi:hypothetical protein